MAMEQPVSPMVKNAKSKNDISLRQNISDSFTKLPELGLGEQFVVQSLVVVELCLELLRKDNGGSDGYEPVEVAG